MLIFFIHKLGKNDQLSELIFLYQAFFNISLICREIDIDKDLLDEQIGICYLLD